MIVLLQAFVLWDGFGLGSVALALVGWPRVFCPC